MDVIPIRDGIRTADKVLEEAKGQYDDVLMIGINYTKDNEALLEITGSSEMDEIASIYYMEVAKSYLISG